MSTTTNPPAASDLVTASQQMLLDALMVEMGALRAIMPGHAPRSDTARPKQDADQDAIFDNMPV